MKSKEQLMTLASELNDAGRQLLIIELLADIRDNFHNVFNAQYNEHNMQELSLQDTKSNRSKKVKKSVETSGDSN